MEGGHENVIELLNILNHSFRMSNLDLDLIIFKNLWGLNLNHILISNDLESNLSDIGSNKWLFRLFLIKIWHSLLELYIFDLLHIVIFSILVNTIFQKIGKPDAFYRFIIPFNWIQSFQAIAMLSFAVLGLIFPPSVFVFIGIGVVIWVTFSLWRVGKEEIGLTGWGATGMIFLSVIIEASLGMLSRSLSMAF